MEGVCVCVLLLLLVGSRMVVIGFSIICLFVSDVPIILRSKFELYSIAQRLTNKYFGWGTDARFP